jgi:hypothetical protein
MHRIALLAAMLTITTAGPAMSDPYSDPFYEFFHYEEAPLPVGGDCGAIAAAIGAEATWYGEFSGKRWDIYFDKLYPFAARGCFESELACRIWQHQALTYIGGGPMYYTSCRLGLG